MRRDRDAGAEGGLYAVLAARAADTVARFGHLKGNPYRRQLARFRRGDPVEVEGWKVQRAGYGWPGLRSWDRVRVTADDRVELVERREWSLP